MPRRKPRSDNRLEKPLWDGQCSWWDDACVKRFDRHAPGQMSILDEFERQRWPPSIDVTKLLPIGGNCLVWARNSVRNLNRKLSQLEFHADGSKHGITWSRLE